MQPACSKNDHHLSQETKLSSKLHVAHATRKEKSIQKSAKEMIIESMKSAGYKVQVG